MKKMKLDLEGLAVDSFPTSGWSGSKGTVEGAEDSMEMTNRVSCYNQCAPQSDSNNLNCPEDSPVTEQTYCYQWTCKHTCENTCDDACPAPSHPYFSCMVTPGPGCTC